MGRWDGRAEIFIERLFFQRAKRFGFGRMRRKFAERGGKTGARERMEEFL